MTQQRHENNVPSPGISGTSATIPLGDKREGEAAPQANPAASLDPTLDQINRLIDRINSTSSLAATTPLPSRPAQSITEPLPSVAQAEQINTTAVTEPTATPVPRLGPHDDEVLRDYMDQFLERVTGKKKEPEATPAPSVTIAAEMIVPISEPEKPREIKRAPESPQNMSRMRELANENARRAIGDHAGRQISATRNSFLGALSLSLISSLLAVTALMGEVGWAWGSAVLVMLLALVLTGRFLVLRRQLRKLNAG